MRDNKGKFLSGYSGNPDGRPSGCQSRLSKELQHAAEDILPLWIDAACKGDEEKQRFLLERGLPKFKAQSPEVNINLDSESNTERIRLLLVAVAKGEIPSSVASEIVSMIAAAAKVGEIEKLKEELAAVKLILSKRKK